MRKARATVFSLILLVIGFINPFSSLAQVPTATYDYGEPTPEQVFEPDQQTIPFQKMPPVPDYYGPLPFAGENHNYSVVLRGNGEAVVTLKAAFSNTLSDKEELRSISLRMPSQAIPSDLTVFQIFAQEYCLRYEPMPYPVPSGMPNQELFYKNPSPRCLEYSESDYYNYYGGGKYQKARIDYSGDTLNITLPKAIKSGKQGAVLVYFRAMGFARKNLFGAYKFEFESVKTENSINNLNIGISADTDHFLKGGQGEVEYRYGSGDYMLKAPELKDGASQVSSPTIDNVLSQLGQGAIVRNAANLAPLESYKVKGMYADSRLKLYSKEMFIVLLAVLFILAIVFLVGRKILKLASTAAIKKEAKEGQHQESTLNAVVSSGIAFISSVILGGYSILVIILNNYLSFANFSDYRIAQVLRVAMVIISFCIYSVGLFIPGLYYGYKKSIGWGVLTVCLTAGFLFLYFIFGLAVIFLFGLNPVMPDPYSY